MKTTKTAALQRARKVLRIERDALDRLGRRLDHHFEQAVELMSRCLGRIVVTGMGKPGIIGQKISATLSSLGVPSLWLHPAEAAHGEQLTAIRKALEEKMQETGRS